MAIAAPALQPQELYKPQDQEAVSAPTRDEANSGQEALNTSAECFISNSQSPEAVTDTQAKASAPQAQSHSPAVDESAASTNQQQLEASLICCTPPCLSEVGDAEAEELLHQMQELPVVPQSVCRAEDTVEQEVILLLLAYF